MPAFFHFSCEGSEGTFRVRGVVKDAYGKRVIEGSGERQPVNITLHDVHIWKISRSGECRFDPVTEIRPNDLLRTPLNREFRMPAFSATAFQNDLSLKKVARYRLEPTQELLGILLVFLGKMRPLPAKILGGLGLVLLYLRKIRKPRNAAHDLVFA